MAHDGGGSDPHQQKPFDALVVELQAELRAIAGRRMAEEGAGHTLQPTALVNEAFLRLIKQNNLATASRAKFLAAASITMRRLLIEHARGRLTDKRGGKLERVSISDVDPAAEGAPCDVLELDEAMAALGQQNPRLEQVVEAFYFGGLKVDEIAEAMNLSPATINKDLAFARAWLKARMKR